MTGTKHTRSFLSHSFRCLTATVRWLLSKLPSERIFHGALVDGTVVALDLSQSRYRVQFDDTELGIEFVQDIDVMVVD